MSKFIVILSVVIICLIPLKSLCQGSHNQERFYKAWELIQQEKYAQALILLEQNITETPNASNIDYEYAWGTLCLAKLCRLDEMVQFYEIVRMKFFGSSRSGGAIRNWDDKLEDAKKSILSCPDKNLQLVIDKLDQLDKKGGKAYDATLEELIKLGSMGNPEAIEDLSYQGAALAELIAEGKLVLHNLDNIKDYSFCQDDVINPTIRKRGSIACVLLPSGMQIALKRFDPEFVIWSLQDYDSLLISIYSYSDKNLPFAVVGDFNGDLIQDVVLHGHNKSSDMIICLLSEKEDYRIVNISKYKVGDWRYSSYHSVFLSHVNSGVIESGFEESTLQLKNDAFEVGFFEKASTLYYYKGDKFLEYTTSD